jgi:hypothetical protein
MVYVDDSVKCCRAEIYADNNKLMYREIGVGTTPTEEEETKDDNNQSQKKVFGATLSTSYDDRYYYKYYVIFAKDSIEANEIVLTKIIGGGSDYYNYDIKEIGKSEYDDYDYIGGYQELNKDKTNDNNQSQSKIFGVTINTKKSCQFYIVFAKDEAEAKEIVFGKKPINNDPYFTVTITEVYKSSYGYRYIGGYEEL